jgi:hypothetical protein
VVVVRMVWLGSRSHREQRAKKVTPSASKISVVNAHGLNNKKRL